MQIPFSPPYIDDDVIAEVTDSLRSGWITTGPKVLQLEYEIAAYCQVEKALAVNSATSAMMLVLHWFGVTRGDEVIVPAYTYCATALAVMHIGATPVMVDIGPDFNIDPEKIRQAITPKTKAVISVDVGGWPCDYDAIKDVIRQSKQKFAPRTEVQKKLGHMLLLADAAHSFGAVYNNTVTGTLANITVFSFHAVKNVTTAEGGVICLCMPAPFDNYELYKTLRLWSLNGQTKDALTKSKAGGWRYDIVYPGFKMNMPDVLAAIGLAQVRKYDTLLLKERRRVFNTYTAAFSTHPWAITPIFEKQGCSSSCHLYPLRINNITEEQRDEIIELITAQGVAVNVHFIPMPLLTVFKNAGYNITDYPKTYLMYSGEISLPVYPQLTGSQCKLVAHTVIEAVNKVI
ncbi:MAG TPA: DegT/DnrJ/EryC1/StrS family aminotransferase [Chitinophagaceae bacterium]|nr:DegT/DnrJ/EryC1/StrS family aminotransferase [Chitinophagaceae bacterium]